MRLDLPAPHFWHCYESLLEVAHWGMGDRAEPWHPSCLANNQPNSGHASRAKWDQQSSQHMSNKCFLLCTTEVLFVQQHIVAMSDWYIPSCFSVAKSCLTFCDPMDCSTLGFPVPLSPRVCLFTESVMPSNHLILCRPLLLPSTFPSIRVFFSASALQVRWP